MFAAIRRVVFFSVLGLSVAIRVAGAGVPYPINSITPTYVDLGGYDAGGQPDPAISFSVTIRDVGNFPMANTLVSCTFNSDVRIYDTIPGAFVYCPCLEVFTDLTGVATFHLPGAGRNSGGASGFTGASAAGFSLGNCGTYVFARAHVATYDENGGVTTKGVEITDLSAWVSDYNSRIVPPTKYRSDFSHNGAVDIVDLSYWVRVYNAGTSRFGGGTFCP